MDINQLCELNSISSLQLSFAQSYIVNENAASWVQINTNCIVRSTYILYTVGPVEPSAVGATVQLELEMEANHQYIDWYTNQPQFALAFVTPPSYTYPL